MLEIWLFDDRDSPMKRYATEQKSAPREWVMPIYTPIWSIAAPGHEALPEPELDDLRYDLFGLVHQSTMPTGLKKDTRQLVAMYALRGLNPEPFELWLGPLAEIDDSTLSGIYTIAKNRLRSATPRHPVVAPPAPWHPRSDG
jgi:hypothetical protein